MEGAKYYYVGGYHLTVCPPAILELGKHAAENNKVSSLSLFPCIRKVIRFSCISSHPRLERFSNSPASKSSPISFLLLLLLSSHPSFSPPSYQFLFKYLYLLLKSSSSNMRSSQSTSPPPSYANSSKKQWTPQPPTGTTSSATNPKP